MAMIHWQFHKFTLAIFLVSICSFHSASFSQNNSSFASKNSKTPDDSISLKIQTYEGIIAELQQRPLENKSLAHIMTQLGNLYSASEDYPRAISIYMKSIVLREKNHPFQSFDKTDIAWQMIDVGNSFFKLNDYQLAEHAYKNAGRYFVLANDKLGMITSVNNIGLCRLNAGLYRTALPLFRKTLALSKQIKDATRIQSSTIYLSRTLTQLRQYDEAIKLLVGLESNILRPEDAVLESYRIIQLGSVYLAVGDTAKAFTTLARITGPTDNAVDGYYKASALLVLAECNNALKNTSLAIKQANEAYLLLQDQHQTAETTQANYLLYRLYKKTGDNTRSLIHFEEYHEGVLQMNTRKIESFASDYKRKMEQIAISQELQRVRQDSARVQSEKSNQQSMSVFLIIISVLLLVVLFSSRGFDSRIQLMLEHVKTYTRTQRISLWIILGLYFVAFYYFFVPLENTVEIHSLNFTWRLIPGILAYGVTFVVILVFYSPSALQKPVKSWYVYSLNTFLVTFTTVMLAEVFYFYIAGFGGVNFLLSLALIVLASFIVPLYSFILIVENLIFKHIESISNALNRDIDEIKQKITPEVKTITICSEKTNGKLSFHIADFISAESQGNYCKFYLKQGNNVVNKMLHITMKSTDEQMAGLENIIRCHKSYLINIHHVVKVTGNSKGHFLHFDKEVEPVPVSRGFQKDVLEIIRHYREDIS